ncbi:MAG: sigma 54-dependent Fis family transcriptional regulator [Deltaproteobacteria bacterium]|nr:sigma 54-dependent Fis family transcriptional regulator [Deltaproteobacteria bacterium]
MADDSTVPLRSGGLPVRMLRVEVVSGPDTGKEPVGDTESVTVGTARGNDLELQDPTVSRYHLELRREGEGILVLEHGSTNGTRIGPVLLRGTSAVVAPATLLEIGETRLRVDDGRVRMLDGGPDTIGGLRGKSPKMRRVLAAVQRLAQTDVQVLVVGESGTGKELVARAIHDLGPRASEPFVVVDCGAMLPTLFASELFGHERGAFTGADRRHVGAFERARGGTVFLDEIGELPAELQAALLGVLERRRLRRVGGSEEIAVDVRVLSATNRDLRGAVNAGTFRLDLYYRLAVAVLAIPALRDRPGDVAILAEHFLEEAGHSGAIESVFSAAELERLASQPWPGNCRELKNLVLGTLALGQAPELGLLSAPEPAGGTMSLDAPYREARGAVLDDFERRYLARLLDRSGGNLREAARQARMDRTYLKELLRRHGLR